MNLEDLIEKRKRKINHPYNKVMAVVMIILLANGAWGIGAIMNYLIFTKQAIIKENLFFIGGILFLLIKAFSTVKLLKKLKIIIMIFYIANFLTGFSMIVPLIWFVAGINVIFAGIYTTLAYKNLKVIEDDIPKDLVVLRLFAMLNFGPIMIVLGLFSIGIAIKVLFDFIF